MPGRITPLVNNEVYHLFNRGSDKRNIFYQPRDYRRFIETFYYYQFAGPKTRFSDLGKNNFKSFTPTPNSRIVEIFCYCLMPNHFHFMVRQLRTNGISTFMSQVANSYTKYFNTKRNRVGPLLQGSFKAIRVETDEQLIHLSRYIHINPAVSGIITNPENYAWSSYTEYLGGTSKLCSTKLIMSFFPRIEEYRKFTKAQIDYGKTLEIIKHQLIDDL